MSAHSLVIEPLNPAIGAIVHGLDLPKPLGDAEFADLQVALLAHQVICLRDQRAWADGACR